MSARPALRPRRRIRNPAALGSIALIAVAIGGSIGPASVLGQSPAPAATGARTLADPFYPTLGNGGYDTVAIDLAVRWSAPDRTHRSGHADVVTSLDLVATQDLGELTLDLVADTATVSAVRIDGAATPFRQDTADRKLTLTLPAALPTGTAFRVEVESDAVPGPVPRTGEDAPFRTPGQTAAESVVRLGRGLIADGDGGMLLAAQPNGAHTLFPVNDHPLDKATYRITLTAPPGMTGIATGTLEAARTGADGSLTTTWVSAQPVASHVVSLGIGDRVLRSGPVVDGVTYRSAIPPEIEPLADELLDELPSVVAWLEDAIGRPYPFDAFGLLVYAGRPTTAILEGQTLVLVPSVVLSPLTDHCAAMGTIVHEAAHQWFGDDVSIIGWDEKWLSEGHATAYEWRWLAEHGCLDEEVPPPSPDASPGPLASVTPAAALDARMERAYADAGAIRAAYGPPAAPIDPAAAYSPAIYDQGALALYALRQEMGDRAFARFQRSLLRRHAGEGVSTDELIALASQLAKRDLGPFLEAWLRGDAVPPMPGRPDWTTDVPSASPSADPGASPAP